MAEQPLGQLVGPNGKAAFTLRRTTRIRVESADGLCRWITLTPMQWTFRVSDINEGETLGAFPVRFYADPAVEGEVQGG